MSSPASKLDIPSTPGGGKLYRFPKQYNSETRGPAYEGLIREATLDALDDPTVTERIKQIVEGAILETYLRRKIHAEPRSDNPFDALYISTLNPDPIPTGVVDFLKKYENIVDLSDTVSFNDGMDD